MVKFSHFDISKAVSVHLVEKQCILIAFETLILEFSVDLDKKLKN